MQTVKDLLDILSSLATILGIPIAILLFYNEKRRERKDREYGTYNALDDKYIDYLRLCLDNPDLDVFDIPLAHKGELTVEQERREMALLGILISILERAFLMYRDQSTKLKKSQWIGWDAYVREWSARANFRRAWKLIEGEQFDADFVAYLNMLISVNGGSTSARPAADNSTREVPAA
jgi:hypothetical protein